VVKSLTRIFGTRGRLSSPAANPRRGVAEDPFGHQTPQQAAEADGQAGAFGIGQGGDDPGLPA
jgi:hypothetical protein